MTSCIQKMFLLGALFALALAASWKKETLFQDLRFGDTHVLGASFNSKDELLHGGFSGLYVIRNPDSPSFPEYLYRATDNSATAFDDVVEDPATGIIYFNDLVGGRVLARDTLGFVRLLAQIPGANSINMNANGRLFVGAVFFGDGFYEINKTTGAATQLLGPIGGLNAFDFGADGLLYGPLWFKKQIVSLDVSVTPPLLKVIANVPSIPFSVAVKPGTNRPFAQLNDGWIYEIFPNGTFERVVKIPGGSDNTAFNSKGELWTVGGRGLGKVDVDAKKLVSFRLSISPTTIQQLDRDTLLFGNGLLNTLTYNLATKTVAFFQEANFEVSQSNVARVFDQFLINSDWFTNSVSIFNVTTKALIEAFSVASPMDVARLPDGRVIVAQPLAGKVTDLTNNVPLLQGLAGPVGLALGRNSLFVSNIFSGEITQMDLQSKAVSTFASGLHCPEGVVVKVRGNTETIYVRETCGDRRLLEFAGRGGPQVVDFNLPGGLNTFGFGVMNGVGLGDDGSLYIGLEEQNSLIRYYQ